MNDQLLIIFTRNPEKGKVKTRLASTVGDAVALEIYEFLLAHTREITLQLAVDKAIYYSEYIPEDDHWESEIYHKALQTGDDLGECMANAFRDAFKKGYARVVIIGSDIYDLLQHDLEKAFKALDNHEYVIGPAQDGGYYLLGMKSMNPALFENIKWGSNQVLVSTLEILKDEKVKELDVRNDVDYYEDIKDKEVFRPFLEKSKLIS